MKFTANFYARMIGAILLAYAGYSFGQVNSSVPPTDTQSWATGLLILCGMAFGLIMSPYLTVKPFQRFLGVMRTMPLGEALSIGLGILVGLLVALLVTIPLAYLPRPIGQYAPILAALVLGYIGGAVANARKDDLQVILSPLLHTSIDPPAQTRLLVDTSIIIDGRIAGVIEAGFIRGMLIVPQFVLHELQLLADSNDDLTRSKGKRGLELLKSLQASDLIQVSIPSEDARDVPEVDDKLVVLAHALHIPLLTNDANLQHVAQLQGVTVLNLNRLAEVLRPQFAVGDHINVMVRNEGREREQGVGFSNDGTMIVVEDARRFIGHDVAAVVTRVYTTQSGKIIFAQLDRSNGHA